MTEKNDEPKKPSVNAANNSIAVGGISAGRDISGNITIGNTGYTVEEVSVLITQIKSTFQPKPFDGRCPYKGLDVFEEEDAELFFGREKLVEDLVSRVKDSRTVFITGPSGSGKSSLVRAGLIHALRQGAVKGSEHWLYATMKPGRDPFDALARGLSRAAKSPQLGDYLRQNRNAPGVLQECVESALSDNKNQRLVLFIDQFEEVFTQISREEERMTFLNLLTYSASIEGGRGIILFAMRSDFVPNCATYPQLNAILNQQFIQIGGMQPEELVSAIAQPALRVGLRIDPDLIAHIINDMKGEPGALPLMQFALKDLFEAMQAKGGLIQLTLNDYLQRGGIQKALEHHADTAFQSLAKEEQELARSIFSGLIEVGRGTQDTKRTAIFHELVPANTNEGVVKVIVRKLADERLITIDGQTVTISHEKLIDAWPWLKRLVNENRVVIALKNEITEDAREWNEHEREKSYLYSGARLVKAIEQLNLNKLALSGTALEYIRAGQARQRRGQILLTGGISTIFVLLVVALVIFNNLRILARNGEDSARNAQAEAQAASTLAIANEQKAKEQAAISRAGELAAESVNQRDVNFQVSLLLGLEAYKTNVTNQTQGALLDNAQAKGELLKYLPNIGGPILAISPDGKMFATDAGDGTILLRDMVSQKTIGGPLKPEEGIGRPMIFSHDGKLLASASCIGSDGQICTRSEIVIWDVSAQQIVAPSITRENSISSLAFSMDDTLLLLGICKNWEDTGYNSFHCTEGDIEFWDLTTGQRAGQTLSGIPALGPGLAISVDRKLIATSTDSSGGGVTIWNTETKQLVKELSPGISLSGHASSATIDAISFSPDGSVLALAVYGDIELFDTSTFDSFKSIKGDDSLEFINCLTFTPDSSILISGSDRGNIIFWDWNQRTYLDPLGDGPIYSFLGGTSDSTSNAGFGADGKTIVTNNAFPQVITLWDVESRQVIKTESTVDAAKLVFSPDGSTFASNDLDGVITIWDAKTLEPLRKNETGQSNSIGPMAFSADNSLLAVNIHDEVLIWDVKTLQPIGKPMIPNGGYINSLAFSPDSKILASANENATIVFWDVKTHEPLGKSISGFSGEATSIAFSPDGKTIAMGNENSKLLLWDVETRSLIQGAVNTGQEAWSAALAFSPDGKYLVSGSNDGTILLWDAKTLQHIGNPIGSGWGSVSSISFDPKGNLIAYSAGYTVLLNISPQYWAGQICQRVGRNFTRAEWEQYFPGEPYRKTCDQWLLEPEPRPAP